MKKIQINNNNHTNNKVNGKHSCINDSFAARFKTNEEYFSSFIDLIPSRIYFNPDDHSYWSKLVTNQSKKKKSNVEQEAKKTSKQENGNSINHSEPDNGEADDEQNDLDDQFADSRLSKFDPRVFKSVSQILKDLERFEQTNKNDYSQKIPLQRPINQNNNEKPNTSIKVFNKSQHKSLSKSASTTDKSESTTDDNADTPRPSNGKSANKRVSKFKEQKNAALKRKRQRYDSQNEAQIVKMDHSDVNGDAATNTSVKNRKPILNKNGEVVFSKFDFTADKTLASKKSKDDKVTPTNAKPKDYKKLLKTLQEKRAKVEELKQKEPEKANELEIKEKWKSALDKASGLKVKDDVNMLKKAVKRLEKKKEKSKKSWQEKQKEVEMLKQKAQDKRRKNIEKRKEKNKEAKIKKLKKKGRILPGF